MLAITIRSGRIESNLRVEISSLLSPLVKYVTSLNLSEFLYRYL